MPGRTAPLKQSLYERDPARGMAQSAMEPAGLQMWRWLAFACLSWICLGQVAAAGPHYMLTIPAVLEAGAESRICMSLLRPNETLQMTVTLMSEEENITLFQQTSDNDLHQLHFRLITLDSKLKLVNELKDIRYSTDIYTLNYSDLMRMLVSRARTVQTTIASVPTGTLQASTGHHSFSYIIGKGELDKAGCATFNFNMTLFTRVEKSVERTELSVSVEVEEEGTGLKYLENKTIQLTYMIGKISFIGTPKVFERGPVFEGKVKAVYFNETPIQDKLLHLYVFETGTVTRLIQNLTTDSDGVASFSFNTSRFQDIFQLTVSVLSEYQGSHGYRTPYYEDGKLIIQLFQPKTEATPTISSLEVQQREAKLVCDVEELINVHFTFVGEAPGPIDIMYLILARGAIARQGLIKVEILDEPVTKGEVTVKFKVSPYMAPLVQVVVYTGLPSENVIAHKADFDTEKCFANQVSLEFSPSAAVPGEENRLQLRAQPDSLCGISAVDQSVLIKDPGKKLNADKASWAA
ncbi:Ovostatin [Merluccius polli]|uniref:Ovostatin n=1 Tax=Merluccius polli TaxID=89951 RepID=A0AA47N428_MERPO|nr:Ovostatin [Merluccius polli]